MAEGDHLTMLNVFEAFLKVSESRRECFRECDEVHLRLSRLYSAVFEL